MSILVLTPFLLVGLSLGYIAYRLVLWGMEWLTEYAMTKRVTSLADADKRRKLRPR